MKKQDKIHKFDRPPLVLKKQYTRPNSMTILEAPSRMSNTLFYPDGRIVYDKPKPKPVAYSNWFVNVNKDKSCSLIYI